nr:hypothetical protein [Mucilaginibacter sp. X4EP1]
MRNLLSVVLLLYLPNVCFSQINPDSLRSYSYLIIRSDEPINPVDFSRPNFDINPYIWREYAAQAQSRAYS